MAWEWWKRLTESEDDKKERQFQQFAQTAEFRKMLRAEAANIVSESRKREKEELKKAKDDHKKKIKSAEENLQTIGKEMAESSEPFVNVLSMGFTSENGLEVKLDYNNAFIRYLNKAGIKGSNEEETIRLWLAHLNYDISEEAKAEDYLMNGVSDDEMPSMSYDEMFGTDEDDEDELDTGWEQSTP